MTLREALAQPVVWKLTGDLTFVFEARVNGRHWRLRLGDFPDEALYTLIVDGSALGEFDDWPAAWTRPDDRR